jgi:aerobic-type carbon monoxide dehydrogenase small subunit (CoxS/CutS family)
MADLREAFSREHALQCGFCTPGMIDQIVNPPDRPTWFPSPRTDSRDA